MGLLTHGGEHHEIGDRGWLMMTMAVISLLRSPNRTPDLPFGGRIGVGVEVVGGTGAHKDKGRTPGGGRAPHPCGQGVGALQLILSPIFCIYSKNDLCEILGHSENFYFCTKITPWQFC